MYLKRKRLGGTLMLVVALSWSVVGCSPPGGGNGNDNGDPDGFTDASATRGGTLYDKWWSVAGVDQPTDDHPLWSTRPDTDSNSGTGADTWRCKECHGWDYKGVDGAYGSGSHRTGISGIFGTSLSAQEVFDSIKDTHSFGSLTDLNDDDIWDLAKFVLEAQIDTDDIIDGDAFNGSAEAGMSIFDSTCAVCHGADGLSVPPGADADHDDWVGKIANENPWEFQHKVRFGQPASAMPAQLDLLSLDEVADLSTYAQTLPTAPTTAGEAFYTDNGCAACHGADAAGDFGPSLVGVASDTILDMLDGTVAHTGDTVDGVTALDATDLEAWLASL